MYQKVFCFLSECIINNWPEESALAAKPEILYDALLASEFCVQPERVGYKIDKVSRDIAGAYYTSSDFSAQITYRALESYMDRKRRRAIDSDSFACCNEQYRRWKFIAVCSAVDDDVKARYDSQKSKGKKGLVAEIDNYEVYALTWDDVFQSFDLRHAFLLDKLKMDKEAIAAEIAQTAGDEKSKDTADALTALVAN